MAIHFIASSAAMVGLGLTANGESFGSWMHTGLTGHTHDTIISWKSSFSTHGSHRSQKILRVLTDWVILMHMGVTGHSGNSPFRPKESLMPKTMLWPSNAHFFTKNHAVTFQCSLFHQNHLRWGGNNAPILGAWVGVSQMYPQSTCELGRDPAKLKKQKLPLLSPTPVMALKKSIREN